MKARRLVHRYSLGLTNAPSNDGTGESLYVRPDAPKRRWLCSGLIFESSYGLIERGNLLGDNFVFRPQSFDTGELTFDRLSARAQLLVGLFQQAQSLAALVFTCLSCRGYQFARLLNRFSFELSGRR